MSGPQPVLVVSNHAEVIGGGEVSLLTLLAGLDRGRWAPVVVVPAPGAVGERAGRLGVPVETVAMPGLRPPSPALVRSIGRLGAVARARDARLLHANGSRAMLYAGLAARRLRRPAVWHVRVLEPDLPLDWLLARLATRIVCISAAVRRRFARWPWALGRTVVVPNGIDLAGFAPARPAGTVRAELGLARGARVVGSVGRFVPYKGYRHLLDAFARLRATHAAAALVLVGDGPERAALERQARALGVEADVRFTGRREDVADLVQVMEVFVLPSVGEHFGRVLLEAMALEVPVVATAAGGVPEIVEDGREALLVPVEDPRALAAAVGALLDDPARAAALARAGRRRVAAAFSLERHAAAMGNVWRAVLEETA